MKIAVFGAGGIGGYLGGRLCQSGEEVAIIARRTHLEAIRQGGLKVDSIKGDFVARPWLATGDPKEVGPVDAVILGVKAWQVKEAADAMRPMLAPGTCVLPLQNGVETPDQLTEVLGEGPAIGGVGGILSFIAGPGHIRHAGVEPFIKLGELDNHPSARTAKLRDALVNAGVDTEIPSSIQAAMWEKLMFMSANSGMGAVTRSTIGEWRGLPETWEMAQRVVEETLAVALARGVPMGGGAFDTAMGRLTNTPAGGTSSMQRDMVDGRPSELDVQNGVVVRLGLEAGVPTPVNAFIYHSLLPQERRARGGA